MALTNEWRLVRSIGQQPLPVKMVNGTTATTIARAPVTVTAGVLEAAATGAALAGVAQNILGAGEVGVVHVTNDVYEVQVKSGVNLACGAKVSYVDDGTVDALGSGVCVGTVVDYDPATGGLAHILTNFEVLAGNDAAEEAAKLPLAGGTMTGNLTLDDVNVILSTDTGTQIGTAAAQKLAFRGTTPVAMPAGAAQAEVVPGNANSEIGGLTFTGAGPTAAECEALRDKCEELADDLRAAVALANAMRTVLVDHGLMKGSA